MRRLGGEDASFLYQEMPIQPMNPVVVAVLRPAVRPDGTPDPITMEYLRLHMARRLGELPSYRWRIEEVPFGLHHPVFIEDPDFDLSYHLRHTVLPAPGGDAELNAFVAKVAERHLDRRHPMWQMTLADGLSEGRQAVVLTYQHALADGVAAVTTFSRVFSGLDHEVAAPAEPWTPERVPGSTALLLGALGDLGRTLSRLPGLVAKTVRNLRALGAHRRRATVAALKPFVDTPVSALNRCRVGERTYTRVSLPLAGVRRVKEAAGTSLNDVVLAVVGGAFRRYLDARDELPERSLTATVPVAFEPPPTPPRQFGNRFSGFTTTFATDVDDPWERLTTIASVTKAGKEELDVFGPELLPDWQELSIPFIAKAIAGLMNRRREKHPEKSDYVNVLVSNIRGPETRWSFGTALIEDLYLGGPPSNGVGSNVMLWSYADHLNFGIISFADSMEDPDELGRHLHDSLDELVRAADARGGAREEGHATP